jgi:hypothetical protein
MDNSLLASVMTTMPVARDIEQPTEPHSCMPIQTNLVDALLLSHQHGNCRYFHTPSGQSAMDDGDPGCGP